jgi:hypothetical protein
VILDSNLLPVLLPQRFSFLRDRGGSCTTRSFRVVISMNPPGIHLFVGSSTSKFGPNGSSAARIVSFSSFDGAVRDSLPSEIVQRSFAIAVCAIGYGPACRHISGVSQAFNSFSWYVILITNSTCWHTTSCAMMVRFQLVLLSHGQVSSETNFRFVM